MTTDLRFHHLKAQKGIQDGALPVAENGSSVRKEGKKTYLHDGRSWDQGRRTQTKTGPKPDTKFMKQQKKLV